MLIENAKCNVENYMLYTAVNIQHTVILIWLALHKYETTQWKKNWAKQKNMYKKKKTANDARTKKAQLETFFVVF